MRLYITWHRRKCGRRYVEAVARNHVREKNLVLAWPLNDGMGDEMSESDTADDTRAVKTQPKP